MHPHIEHVLRDLGPELFGWMMSSLGSETEAGDAFSLFAEELWKSLARYDGRCSMRTWCYMLARHTVARARAARANERLVPIGEGRFSEVAAEVRETTLRHLRTDAKDRVRALREQLDPDDRELLVLRVDKDLGWRDIALVMLGEGTSDEALTRHAAVLRKRFERVKKQLRARYGVIG
ncbi:sigma-70 family RNA polymerase sigma factor [Pendulispora rubella]|uniref:Sigma-70 family RNA polymerase sigma factor n=1 Tax=Pendulispora rubella TaxID=2741070 RepID=A0ABZ2LAY9_9BACT